MKKIIFALIIFFTFYDNARAAVALIKSELDTNFARIKGSITIASTKKEQITLTSYEDMQILYQDKRIEFNKKTNEYIIDVDTLSPIIISFIKNISSDIDTIRDDFISIYSSIIPSISNIEKADLYITLPENFIGLTSGFVTHNKNDLNVNHFTYSFLPENISLVASTNYTIKSIKQKNIDIYALLLKGHETLADQLLQKAGYYIKMYEDLFTTYFPYHNFIIAEDINPYGHALPSMAVFGTAIIDKDYIIERSLGHEVLHQWFGSSIKADNIDGNLMEAITTYFSDYYYNKNNMINYRKEILEKYEAYAIKSSFPLKDFKYNAGKTEQAIGYGKGLMVLHMAKNKVGEEIFLEGIRNFIKDKMYKSGSWKDLLSYINIKDDFYNFWVHNKNNITLDISDINIDDNNTLTFNLTRQGGEEEVEIPFTHISGDRTEGKFITKKGINHIVYELSSPKDIFILDDKYDLMRNLFYNEITPTFDYLITSDDILFIGDKSSINTFKEIFPNINNNILINKANIHHLKDNNVIIAMGNTVPQPITELLHDYINFTFEIGATTYKIIKNPYSDGDKFIIFSFNHTEDTLNKLKYYGAYSHIIARDNQVIFRDKDKSFNGMKVVGD